MCKHNVNFSTNISYKYYLVQEVCSHTINGTPSAAATVSTFPVEAKNLPPSHDLRHTRDAYVIVALDQEEIFRTATAEKTLK